ncbi:hypothetical protein YDYSY3_54240 [Paenibacillus chitinolyticus]|nr:hypothetical protein YDYSY3_54240 [Paenibacillus chitinolyticus]
MIRIVMTSTTILLEFPKISTLYSTFEILFISLQKKCLTFSLTKDIKPILILTFFNDTISGLSSQTFFSNT